MAKVHELHDETDFSLTCALQRMSTVDIQMRAVSNPELLQEWIDELVEEHSKCQAKADRLKEEIDRLRAQSLIATLKVA